MNVYAIVLRFIHIGFGVLWAGSAMLTAWFLEPAARGEGPDLQRAYGRILQKSNFGPLLIVFATLNVVSGVLLYLVNTAYLSEFTWLRTGTGIVITVGAIAALISYVVGAGITAPTSGKLFKVGGEIAASEGPPPEEKLGLLKTLQARVRSASMVNAIMLAVAVIAMAVAQYAN